MKFENIGGESTSETNAPEELLSQEHRNQMTLEELLEGIPEGTCLGEFDWGAPRGAEIWWETEDEREEPGEDA